VGKYLTQRSVCVTIVYIFIIGDSPLTLLSIALPQEFSKDNKPYGYELVYTGVGKINSTFALTKAILETGATEVINYGSAGSVNGFYQGLVEVDTILQRDMVAEPLAPRGETPYQQDDFAHAIILNSGTNITLGTGDSFVNTNDPWFKYANIDLVDMEGYALAVVCAKLGVKFRCFKYVSDNADENSADDWEKSLKNGEIAFQNWLQN